MNNVDINETEKVIELNFLEELSQHRYFKWLFEIEFIKRICEMPVVKKIFDHQLTKKFMNREMIMYLIFGVLATVVNIGAFSLFRFVMHTGNDMIDLNVANFLAITSSILFAYFTNKIWVFRSKTETFEASVIEFIKFISARSITAVLELLGVPFLVYAFHSPEILAKVLLTVIVIITNYVLSKKAIFNKI